MDDRAASCSSYVSSQAAQCPVQAVQLAMRLHWPVQRIHGGNGWERDASPAARRETLNRAALREALEYGNGTFNIGREEHLWLGSR